MDSLLGELLLESDWAAIAKVGMELFGIVNIVDEVR
jgi:hypothetical protein